MTKRVNGTRRAIMLADVKTAFLHGDARRSLYVELPPEDPLAPSGRYVGKHERAMYGTREGCFSTKHETFSFVCMLMICCAQGYETIWFG